MLLPALRLGGRAGVVGVVVAALIGGAVMGIVFTAVYDGPRPVEALPRKGPRST